MTEAELLALAPLGVLVGGALVCLTLEAAGTPIGAIKRGRRTHLALIGISAALAAAFLVGLDWPAADVEPLFGVLAADRIGHVATQLLILLVALTLGAAVPALRAFGAPAPDLEEIGEERGDRYALMLLASAGLLATGQAEDLMLVAAGVVLSGVALAALLVVDRREPRGAEAAVKLLLLTTVQLCVLGLGAAFLWGHGGSTTLGDVVEGLAGVPGWTRIGALFAATGLLIVLGAFPFHAARVDIIQGAPSFLGGLIASSGLVVGTALWVRAFGPDPAGPKTALGLTVVAGASLLLPAVAALDQRNVDRMIAHLCVSQAGVALLPLVLVAAGHGERAGLALIAAAGGALAIFGVFVCLGCLENKPRGELTWEQWSGLGRRHPLYALTLLWLLGSLAGFGPATAGFASRLGTARAAFDDGQVEAGWLAALGPVVAAIVVIRFGVFLFAKVPGARGVRPAFDPWRVLVLALCCLGVLALGVAPEAVWTRYLADLLP